MNRKNYLNRWNKKYKKLKSNGGSLREIIIYILNDLVNIFLTNLVPNPTTEEIQKNYKILFIEPRKQGFGDLLFQTPIFEAIGEKCTIDILCMERHSIILNNNPFIRKYTSNAKDLTFSEYSHVIYLSRSTVLENINAFKLWSAKKIPLDKNLQLWTDLLNKNDYPTFWKKIIQSYFYIGDEGFYSKKPKIYLLNKRDNTIIPDISIVAGTENIDKSIKNIDYLFELINRKFSEKTLIALIGKSNGKNERKTTGKHNKIKILNLIGKQTYEECLQIIHCSKIIIAPEGSLAHMSTVLNKPTIIIEDGRNYNKINIIEDRKNLLIINQINIKTLKLISDFINTYLK